MSKKQETSTEVTTVETFSKEVAIPLSSFEGDTFSANDMMIPKILPMQGMSPKVIEGIAKFGQFISSLDDTILGDLNNPIEFIPFHWVKYWNIYEKKTENGKTKRIYMERIPVTAANERLPWNDVVNGKEIARVKVYSYFVIVPGHILPFIINFQSSSIQAGIKLNTFVKMLEYAKQEAWNKAVILSGRKEQNDDGIYVVMDVKHGRDTTPAEREQALYWKKSIPTLKYDEAEEVTVTEPNSAPLNQNATEFAGRF